MRGLILSLLLVVAVSEFVQIPYQRVAERPSNNPYCQAKFQFCPVSNPIPMLDADDTVEVYALQAPIWEFKFGSLMGKVHAYHDAIGVKSLKTGKNYTMEWYELDQLLNCTFPHEVKAADGEENVVWCNQGAACFYEGINDIHWTQNGSMRLVAEMTGDSFNKYGEWMKKDNDTGVYYETWSIIEKWEEDDNKRNFTMGSYDCKDFVLRSFDAMATIGAKFNTSLEIPKYTYISLHPKSMEPVDYNEHKKDIQKFYKNFQRTSVPAMLEELAYFLTFDLLWAHKFYLYYNQQYYLLKLHWPYISLHYGQHRLPGQ